LDSIRLRKFVVLHVPSGTINPNNTVTGTPTGARIASLRIRVQQGVPEDCILIVIVTGAPAPNGMVAALAMKAEIDTEDIGVPVYYIFVDSYDTYGDVKDVMRQLQELDISLDEVVQIEVITDAVHYERFVPTYNAWGYTGQLKNVEVEARQLNWKQQQEEKLGRWLSWHDPIGNIVLSRWIRKGRGEPQ